MTGEHASVPHAGVGAVGGDDGAWMIAREEAKTQGGRGCERVLGVALPGTKLLLCAKVSRQQPSPLDTPAPSPNSLARGCLHGPYLPTCSSLVQLLAYAVEVDGPGGGSQALEDH